METMSDVHFPPPAFHFDLSFSGAINEGPSNSFQEVSGIKTSLDVEEVKEGGDNRFTHKLPSKSKYDNLVLHKGLMLRDAAITKWCIDSFNGISNKLEPKDISVMLMDTEGTPLMEWHFKNAWPVSWTLSDMDANSNEIIIESLEFAYTYFTAEAK